MLGSSLDVLLQGQRAEVESMIMDMGVSQAAVEQLSIYCISLKKWGSQVLLAFLITHHFQATSVLIRYIFCYLLPSFLESMII